jgi:hypothetical protein
VRCILRWRRAESVVRACLPFSPTERFFGRQKAQPKSSSDYRSDRRR